MMTSLGNFLLMFLLFQKIIKSFSELRITFCLNDFNSLLPKFKKLDCLVIGISKDNIESHLKFKKKYNIKFDLLADEKKEAIKGYKTWGKKKFMGREFMGLIRSTFVIKDQKIIKEWRSVKVKDHALEVLDFIKNH